MFRWLRKLICDDKSKEELRLYRNFLKPKVDVGWVCVLDSTETYRLIRKRYPNAKLFAEDRKHRLIDQATMTEIVKKDWLPYLDQYLVYINDFFDCNDFSRVFKDFMITKYRLNCVGRVLNYTAGYSFNLLVLKDGVFVFEPQTGQIWENPINENYKVDG